MEQQSPFQRARQQIMETLNLGEQITKEDQATIHHALQAAYQEATPEERQELEQLEQQLDSKM